MNGVVFDMDGVLIDSEPYWRSAEMEVFGRLGCHLTEDDCRMTTGLSVLEVVDFWHERRRWHTDHTPLNRREIAQEIRKEVIKQVKESGTPKPGILEALQYFSAQNLPIGLASGSEYEIINVVVDTLEIRKYFHVIVSTEEFPLGKPHPAVYLETCSRLALPPTQVLAIEDSVNGMIAAKAARMACVVIPDDHNASDPRFGLADAKLSSVNELDEVFWQALRARTGRE
jgi:mannitol-1-/sugar-/sorbitol-6-/2-deoxyglucose-6-phosphatase